MLYVFIPKKNLAVKENTLSIARKVFYYLKIDLEFLFQSKHNTKVNRDTTFVQFVFDLINAVAKTITNVVETNKNLKKQLEGNKTNLETIETKLLLILRSILRATKCELFDVILEVCIFLQHALQKLPKHGVMYILYPYCSRMCLLNAFQ